MTKTLEGRVALVTGASRGLGRDIALKLAANGASVALLDRKAHWAEDLVQQIEADGGKAIALGCDVSDGAALHDAFDTAAAELGGIDIVVNNAMWTKYSPIEGIDAESLDKMLGVGIAGIIWGTQAAAKHMRARGSGSIVNIASMAGLRVLGQIGVYAMSKSAVVHMTRAMALEWGRYGINVNALCPGYIDTEINHHHWQTDAGQKLMQMLPRKRVGQPQDLDSALMMLCANESRFINGAVISADDGYGA